MKNKTYKLKYSIHPIKGNNFYELNPPHFVWMVYRYGMYSQ